MAKFTVKKMPGWLITLISVCVVIVLAFIVISIYAEATDQSFVEVFKPGQTAEKEPEQDDENSDANVDIEEGQEDDNIETTAVITIFKQ